MSSVHAHPGSQMTGSMRHYFEFMVNTFSMLLTMGFSNLKIINFGGGLPINYFGDLPGDLIEQYFLQMADCLNNLNFPVDIMVEAGRAITAHSSLVLVEPIDYLRLIPQPRPISYSPKSIEQIKSEWASLSKTNVTKFSLIQRIEWETHVSSVKNSLRKHFFALDNFHEYLSDPIIQSLTTPDFLVIGNFSVFNSACDHVLVNQYFPVISISHLNTQPDTMARLVDITCDSDGELSNYYVRSHPQPLSTKDGYPLTSPHPFVINGVPIHLPVMGNYFAVLLLGAYQDIIEFDHNLIGDLPDVELSIKKTHWEVSITSQGEPIQDILKEVGYSLHDKRTPYLNGSSS